MPLHQHREGQCRRAGMTLSFAAMCALLPNAIAAQASATPVAAGHTSPESVLGVAMGANRRALREYLVARGWTVVADSIADIGTPSLYAGKLAGRPAEVIAMFGASSGRLVNLAINLPVTSPAELRTTYADLYRMLERTRCAGKVAKDYQAQLDSILRGATPYLPPAGSVNVLKPLLPDHTTLAISNNMDWPTPIWANAEAQIGTQLSAVRLDKESRWPFEVSLWSSVSFMLERTVMCADSRAAVDSAARADRDERLASRKANTDNTATIDSVVVIAGPGVTLRVDTLLLRGTEPNGEMRKLLRNRGSTVHYDARVAAEYEGLKVIAADTAAAAKGTIILDRSSMIMAVAQHKLRAETRRLYDLLRAELTSKNPLAAYVAVECEEERLLEQYPTTAEEWIDEVSSRAHDPQKDSKAMRRLDDALGGHLFGGCAEDSRKYQGKP